MRILSISLMLGMVFLARVACGQSLQLSPDSAVALALRANGHVLAYANKVKAQKEQIKLGSEIGPTAFNLLYGQYNSYPTNDNNITLSQSLPFPATMQAKKAHYEALYGEAEANLQLAKDRLAFDVRNACASVHYLEQKLALYQRQDSLYGKVENAALLRYNAGEGNYLEWQQAKAKKAEFALQVSLLARLLKNEETHLRTLLQQNENVVILWQDDSLRMSETFDQSANASLQVLEASIKSSQQEVRLEKSQFWPAIQVSYFNQSLIGGLVSAEPNAPLADKNDRFQGVGLGISIPLWVGPQLARVRAAQLNSVAAELDYEQSRLEIQSEWENQLATYLLGQSNLKRFEEETLPLAKTLQDQALLAQENGNISFTEYLFQLNDALQLLDRYVQLQYQNNLDYHQLLLHSGKIQTP